MRRGILTAPGYGEECPKMSPSEAEKYMAGKEPSTDAAWYCFLGMGAFVFAGMVAKFFS